MMRMSISDFFIRQNGKRETDGQTDGEERGRGEERRAQREGGNTPEKRREGKKKGGGVNVEVRRVLQVVKVRKASLDS